MGLMTGKEVCKALEIHYQTLAGWRKKGCPVFFMFGINRYMYDLESVKSWAKQNSRKFIRR